jgi:hypothetical protein
MSLSKTDEATRCRRRRPLINILLKGYTCMSNYFSLLIIVCGLSVPFFGFCFMDIMLGLNKEFGEEYKSRDVFKRVFIYSNDVNSLLSVHTNPAS